MKSPLPMRTCPDPLDRVRYLPERYMEVLVRPAVAWGLLHEIGNFAAVAAWQPSTETVEWPPFNDNDVEVVGVFESTETRCVPTGRRKKQRGRLRAHVRG